MRIWWSHRCLDVTPVGFVNVFAEGCRSAGGGIFGGQIGQASQWVFGLEAQGDWANLRLAHQQLRSVGTTDTRTLLTPGLTVGALNVNVPSISANTRADVNMITARINYRFGGPSVPHY
jgi:outer membrane immunogenic protein